MLIMALRRIASPFAFLFVNDELNSASFHQLLKIPFGDATFMKIDNPAVYRRDLTLTITGENLNNSPLKRLYMNFAVAAHL